jgi:3-methyladenine DNA glycosylase AlkD
MNCQNIINELKTQFNPRNAAGMARFGIKSKNVLGISIPVLRKMAKKIGKNHSLAGKLWDSNIHEARILACYIDEQTMVTEK